MIRAWNVFRAGKGLHGASSAGIEPVRAESGSFLRRPISGLAGFRFGWDWGWAGGSPVARLKVLDHVVEMVGGAVCVGPFVRSRCQPSGGWC